MALDLGMLEAIRSLYNSMPFDFFYEVVRTFDDQPVICDDLLPWWFSMSHVHPIVLIYCGLSQSQQCEFHKRILLLKCYDGGEGLRMDLLIFKILQEQVGMK